MAKLPENNIYGNDLVYNNKENKCTFICGSVPARLVLYLLSWSGFLVSFMMRTDINLAIVAMIDSSTQPTNSTTDTFNTTEPSEICYNPDTLSSNVSLTETTTNNDGFDWSPEIQSYILASFYWFYIISQIFGGIATQKFGTKRVFGYAQLATAVCSLLIPSFAKMHFSLVILLRSLQGFASGLTWPAMYDIVNYWIPQSERSRFMSSFQGFSIGIGLTYPLAGFIIANCGWPYVFYTTGSLGTFWCVCWYLLAFDSPAEHPRISQKEYQYISANTNVVLTDNKTMLPTPWRKIFLSLPVLSIGVTTFGRIWIHYIFIISGPQYIKEILGLNIQQNGLLSGLPFILSYLGSLVFCSVADFTVNKQLLSLLTVRKICTFLSQVLPGILCVLISYIGCNITVIIIFWFSAIILITASYAGAMANIVDLSPNFAGPVLAFCQTIHMSASFISPLVNGYLTKNGHNLTAWKTIFWLGFVIASCTYVMYQVFASADVQSFDSSFEHKSVKKRNKSDQNTEAETPMITDSSPV